MKPRQTATTQTSIDNPVDIDLLANRKTAQEAPHIRRMRRWRAGTRFLFFESGLPPEWLDALFASPAMVGLWELEGRSFTPEGDGDFWRWDDDTFGPPDPEIDCVR